MKNIKILHTADLHLDSAFEALPAGKAAIRRAEQRELLSRLAELARSERVDLVLLPGDIFDGGGTYFETGAELVRCLRDIPVPVFIAPGNHDPYDAHSPYAKLDFPENVHIFTSSDIECAELPELGVCVYGAAFTGSDDGPCISAFHAEREEGLINILCAHAELGFEPVNEQALAGSGIDYAALGHIHKPSGLRRAGDTWYSWPGCPEGRGFDETGEKSVSIIELSDSGCKLGTVCIAARRYELLPVDVTGCDPLLAVHTVLPEDSARDVYRIILTGEVDSPPDMSRLRRNLDDCFFALQLRDETRLRRDVWERAEEDSLRGIFLRKLRDKYDAALTADERELAEQAARWGLAALDNMEEVVRHEDK